MEIPIETGKRYSRKMRSNISCRKTALTQNKLVCIYDRLVKMVKAEFFKTEIQSLKNSDIVTNKNYK